MASRCGGKTKGNSLSKGVGEQEGGAALVLSPVLSQHPLTAKLPAVGAWLHYGTRRQWHHWNSWVAAEKHGADRSTMFVSCIWQAGAAYAVGHWAITLHPPTPPLVAGWRCYLAVPDIPWDLNLLRCLLLDTTAGHRCLRHVSWPRAGTLVMRNRELQRGA